MSGLTSCCNTGGNDAHKRWQIAAMSGNEHMLALGRATQDGVIPIAFTTAMTINWRDSKTGGSY